MRLGKDKLSTGFMNYTSSIGIKKKKLAIIGYIKYQLYVSLG